MIHINFFEWNNGITITVDDVSIKNNELYLKGAQIVNGAQTSKSILDKKKKQIMWMLRS